MGKIALRDDRPASPKTQPGENFLSTLPSLFKKNKTAIELLNKPRSSNGVGGNYHQIASAQKTSRKAEQSKMTAKIFPIHWSKIAAQGAIMLLFWVG